MIKQIPVFKDGSILRTEMLEKLADFSFVLPNLMHEGFTDGVISGCDVTEFDGRVVVSKGVVMFSGQLFLIDEEFSAKYKPTNKTVFLKLCYFGKEIVKNGINHKFAIELSQEKIKSNEIALCCFKLQDGARLRFLYDDFEDLNTEYDTINIIHTVYSSKKYGTLNPRVLKIYAKELLSFNPQNMADIAFCMQILGGNMSTNIEAINAYILLKTGEDIDNVSNFKVYKSLLSILNDEKIKAKGHKSKNTIKKRTIMVD